MTARAGRDLRAAVDWIAEENPASAQRLADLVLAAAQRIGANPALGARRPALVGPHYRFWRITGFPYLLLYSDRVQPPRILRIVHTSRDLPRTLRALSRS